MSWMYCPWDGACAGDSCSSSSIAWKLCISGDWDGRGMGEGWIRGRWGGRPAGFPSILARLRDMFSSLDLFRLSLVWIKSLVSWVLRAPWYTDTWGFNVWWKEWVSTVQNWITSRKHENLIKEIILRWNLRSVTLWHSQSWANSVDFPPMKDQIIVVSMFEKLRSRKMQNLEPIQW